MPARLGLDLRTAILDDRLFREVIELHRDLKR
jgi:hypothetical protein